MDKQKQKVNDLLLAWLLAFIATAVAIAISFSITGAQSNFDYYVDIQIQNNNAGSITSRIGVPINAVTLTSGGFMKSDGTDTELTYGGNNTQLMATNIATNASIWYTDILTLPGSSNNSYRLYMGDPTYTRNQRMTSMTTDVSSIAHVAAMNITSTITLSANTYLYNTPTATATFIEKPGQYSLYATNRYVFSVNGPGDQNLLTYTEVDAPGTLAVTSSRASATNVADNTSVYLYRDFGIGYFNSLSSNFEILIGSASTGDGAGGIAFSNVVGDITAFGATDISVVAYRSGPWPFAIGLIRGNSVAIAWSAGISGDTVYYLTLRRSTGSDTISLDIYSDSARTVLVDTLSLAGFGAGTTYRYAYGFINQNGAAPGQRFTGYVQNLGFAPVVVSYPITLNQWTEVAGTYIGSSIGLSINNIQVATASANGSIASSTASAYWSFTGLMDRLRVGGTAASPTWVLAYDFEPNQISSNTINDLSGSNNPASITWAGNPSGVTISVGYLQLANQAVSGTNISNSGGPQMLPAIVYIQPQTSTMNTDVFLYPFVKGIFDMVGWPEVMVLGLYRVIFAAIMFIAALAIIRFGMGWMMATGVTAFIIGIAWYLGIYPWWLEVAVIPCCVLFIMLDKKQDAFA